MIIPVLKLLSDKIVETQPPTAEELDLLRNVIDPYGVRELELLSGKKRLAKIREIYKQEVELKIKNPYRFSGKDS